jgi:hypothetical protein
VCASRSDPGLYQRDEVLHVRRHEDPILGSRKLEKVGIIPALQLRTVCRLNIVAYFTQSFPHPLAGDVGVQEQPQPLPTLLGGREHLRVESMPLLFGPAVLGENPIYFVRVCFIVPKSESYLRRR